MNAQSLATLAGVDPTLAALVQAAAATLEAAGTYLCVYQGYRTAAQQNALYAQGRTAPGHIVTNAKAGYSNHNYGMAVDVVPYLTGDSGALNWDDDTPQYKAMVEALKAQGLVYGGDWVKFPDNDHFQLDVVPASPSAEMLADFTASVPLLTMWSNCSSGLYSEANVVSATVNA